MADHRFGTIRTPVDHLKVGKKVNVLLGRFDRAKPAEICGPVHTEPAYDNDANRFLFRTVLVRVVGEKLLRQVAVERIQEAA